MSARICLYTVFLSFLSSCIGACSNGRITVNGTALNDKGGAFVLTQKGMYFLDKMDEWDEKYYGKKVKVTGKLIIEKHEAQSTDSIQIQEKVGTLALLKRPKWSLIE